MALAAGAGAGGYNEGGRRMKARLTNGTIVTLEKDCGCIIHDGPHWLHADAVWKRLNNEHKDKLGRRIEELMAAKEALRQPDIWNVELAWRAYAKEEQMRLAEKLRNMECLGIEELLLEAVPT